MSKNSVSVLRHAVFFCLLLTLWCNKLILLLLTVNQLTNASSRADSASLLCCNILCAMTGLEAGLRGGLSDMPLLLNLLRLESLDGLVSLEASLEPVVERGIPEDKRLGLGESCSVLRLYIYANRELGEPERLVAKRQIFCQ